MEGTILDYVVIALLSGIFLINLLSYMETSQRMYRLSKRIRKLRGKQASQ